ncbi:flagellin protein FlaA [Bacillus sp. JCM 19045]|nr:flagellin protein FlaA [Bacillus sp. JCM 19045]
MDARSLGIGILHTQHTSAVTSQVTNVTTSHIARLRVDENDPSKDLIGRFIKDGPDGSGYYLDNRLEHRTETPEANGTYRVQRDGVTYEVILEEETLTTSTNSLRYTDLTGNEQTATWQTATDQQQAGYYTDGTLIQATDEAYRPNQTINITLDGAPTSLTGVNLSTSSAAQLAIGSIDLAITRVSSERSKLGATQNRLTHTISNVLNTSENLQAAESRIRDVDMAKEIMELTKHQLLAQASQAMLFQANQAPQQVLQLLG